MTSGMPSDPLRSEDHILTVLDEYFPQAHPDLLLGRGHDCAVMRQGGPWAVTCDVFVEDAHFRRRYFSPADIGHKALAVNLSDLAAQGARASAFTLGLTLTGREDVAWLRDFCEGMAALARTWNVALAGGDLARSSLLHVSITAWGELDPSAEPDQTGAAMLRRGQAQEGDIIYTVGPLGLARAGLELLESTRSPEDAARVAEAWPAACAAHLRPLPLLDEGARIARLAAEQGMQGGAKGEEGRFSLMDVSDGLARDLPRLLDTARTGLGAVLELPENVLPPEVRRYAARQGGRMGERAGRDAALFAPWFAYDGGEDYALAGTCPPRAWPAVQQALSGRAYCLGTASRGPITLNGTTQGEGGFDHFA